MDKVSLLLLGDLNLPTSIPDALELTGVSPTSLRAALSDESMEFDSVLLAEVPYEADIPLLENAGEPYTWFYLEDLPDRENAEDLLRKKCARPLRREELPGFLHALPECFWRGQYGEKSVSEKVDVAPWYRGEVMIEGTGAVFLEGDYGEKEREIVTWRGNHIRPKNKPRLEFWLEYQADETVGLSIVVRSWNTGAAGLPAQTFRYSAEDMKEPVFLPSQPGETAFSFSLAVSGCGKLRVGVLHVRYSRLGAGTLLPGGRRSVDSEREEILWYLHPGDEKPPLNVYFGGWGTAEVFEGYFMMREMKAPFLLLRDPRLYGGSYYVGTREYEEMVLGVIQNAMSTMGFTQRELILSGLSMGTYAAAYYGTLLLPRAIVLGKPLLSAGTIAEDERIRRPSVFPASIDMLMNLEGGISPEDAAHLNEKMWARLCSTDFSGTRIAVAHMLQDDYDTDAYPRLLRCLESRDVQFIGRGYVGRHNDNTNAIARYFLKCYREILAEDFGRKDNG